MLEGVGGSEEGVVALEVIRVIGMEAEDADAGWDSGAMGVSERARRLYRLGLVSAAVGGAACCAWSRFLFSLPSLPRLPNASIIQTAR